jgi:hypothetical protein
MESIDPNASWGVFYVLCGVPLALDIVPPDPSKIHTKPFQIGGPHTVQVTFMGCGEGKPELL